MLNWKNPPWAGCNNSPDFQRIFRGDVKMLVNAGVDAIHIDDPYIPALSASKGIGCFCIHCEKLFKLYLTKYFSLNELQQFNIHNIVLFDYRSYIIENYNIVNAKQYKGE
jgi:hypothetical protein